MADRFWVGGSATWDATAGTKWATTSGGAGGASVPTSSDNVFFDAASGAVTVTASATTTAATWDFTGFTGTFNTASQNITINGGLVMSTGMTWTQVSGATSFNATTDNGGIGWPITMNGKTMNGVVFNGGASSAWTLQDTFTLTSSISFQGGTLNTNNQTVSASGVTISTATTKVMNLGSSAINLTSFWEVTGSGLTLNAGTSTVTITAALPRFTSLNNGYTYYDIVLTSARGCFIGNGSFSCRNLSIITDSIAVSNIYNTLFLLASITCTGTFTITNNVTGSHYLLFHSGQLGVTRTITAAATSFTGEITWQDITAAGAAAPFVPGGSATFGDGQGNTNITFTASQTNYWVGGTGAWNDPTHWASTSGGTGGTGRVPAAHDDVRVDANSGSGYLDMRYIQTYCRDLDLTGSSITSLVGFATEGGFKPWFYGSFTGDPNVSFQNLTAAGQVSASMEAYWVGRGACTFDCRGMWWGQQIHSGSSLPLCFGGPGGSMTLLSDLKCNTLLSIGVFGMSNGTGTLPFTFNTNGYDIYCAGYKDALNLAGVMTHNFGDSNIYIQNFGTSGNLIRYTPTTTTTIYTGNPKWRIQETDMRIVDGGLTKPLRRASYGLVRTDYWYCLPNSTSLINDIDIKMRVKMEDWIPNTGWLGASNPVYLCRKVDPSFVQQWQLMLSNTGTLQWQMSTDGASMGVAVSSTAAISAANNETLWIRFTRNKTTGDLKFYTAPDQVTEPSSWTQLGTTVSSSTSSYYNSGAHLTTGDWGMTVYNLKVADSIDGTPVVNTDFTAVENYRLSFTDPTGHMWRSSQSNMGSTTARILGGALAGGNVSTAFGALVTHNAAQRATNELEIASRLALRDWTPATSQMILSKGGTSNATTAYRFLVNNSTAGTLQLNLSDGSSLVTPTSTVALSAADGAFIWVKATWRSSDGRVQFFHAADQETEPSSWTQLGTDVTSGFTTNLNNITAEMQIGAWSATRANSGWIKRVIVRNAIGGSAVMDVDFTSVQDDSVAFSEKALGEYCYVAAIGGGPVSGKTFFDWQMNGTGPEQIGAIYVEPGGARYFYFNNGSTMRSYPHFYSDGGRWVGFRSNVIYNMKSFVLTGTRKQPRSAILGVTYASNPSIRFSDGLRRLSNVDISWVTMWDVNASNPTTDPPLSISDRVVDVDGFGGYLPANRSVAFRDKWLQKSIVE